ncbi:MAG TPA: hypothetical protein VNL95_00530 [Dehalococcoidia bacterium]|nr:hypothetical protein [Dehalococcoidia bacterium]
MALRLLGDGVGQRATGTIVYIPALADSGDMEPGTRPITATARPASPDYSASLTIAAPPDPRLSVLRAGVRARVTVVAFGGSPAATVLFYVLRVNGSDRLSGSWTATGNQTVAEDLLPGAFNLGSPNLVELFLWVDRGQVDINLAQFWLAVGSKQPSSAPGGVLQVRHQGLMSLVAQVDVAGSGSPTIALAPPQQPSLEMAVTQGVGVRLRVPCLLADNCQLFVGGSAATDLNYLRGLVLTLEEPA